MNMLADTRTHAHTKQTCTYIHVQTRAHTRAHREREHRALTTQAGTDPGLSWESVPWRQCSVIQEVTSFWGGLTPEPTLGGSVQPSIPGPWLPPWAQGPQ